MSSERSTGIRIWAILLLLIGAVGVAAGIMGVAGILYSLANIAYGLVQPLITTLLVFLVPIIDLLNTPIMFALLGIVGLALGALFVAGGVGLFLMKPWGRILGMICGLIMIVVVIGLLLVIYLNNDETKMAFGAM